MVRGTDSPLAAGQEGVFLRKNFFDINQYNQYNTDTFANVESGCAPKQR
jgi:hypothetical protein